MYHFKVSIIVPIYNVEKYFPRCMDSLLNQTLKEIEIILVDDESPDNCPKMCNEYAKKDERIKVIHKTNGGLGFARNSGIDIATGEFLAFIDSDDYVDVSMFEKLYNTAKNKDLDTVYCGFNKVNSKLEITPVKEVETLTIFDTQEKIEGVLLDMIGTEPSYPVDRKYSMSVWHGIYSKSIIDENDIKFPSERQFISEDIIFHIDYLLNAKKIAFIPDAMYYYCSNESSLTKSYRADRFERHKILHAEICRKMSLKIETDKFQLRADRLLIGYTRASLFSLGKYDLSSEEKTNIVKLVCNDPIWNKLLEYYPIKELPFKYKFVLKCMKNKWFRVIVLTMFLENIIKGRR